MSQELIGLEYLKKEEIENKRCNTDKPFVFISYSHDRKDASIVRTVFNKLYDKGLNIWIDTANMPVNEDDWKESAIKALMNHNCKFAFFFRSESSLIKETIKEELTVIKSLNHISSIKTIDIWHDSKYDTSKYKTELLNKGPDYYDSYSVCNQICGIVKPECNALRLAVEFENDINKLVVKMISEAAKAGVDLNSSVETIKSVAPDVFDDVAALPLETIKWSEFDKVKSFSYNGEFYNVSDAQHAYIAIVDIIHQNDSDVNPSNIIDHALPKYVRFEDGTELSIPKNNYGTVLKDIAKEKIVLYADRCRKGKDAPYYEILSRNPEKHSEDITDSFSDSLEHFAYYFSKFYDKKNAEWKEENNTGRMPSIDMEVAIDFKCKDFDSIKWCSLKKLFSEIFTRFYQLSGNRYYDYIVDVCAKTGTKYPLIINESFAGDKRMYSQIEKSEYWVYNNYSPREILKYVNKHIEMYFDYWRKEGILDNSPEVIADYRFANQKDAEMMRAIREKGVKSEATDEIKIVSEVRGEDLKDLSKYPSTKGGKGRVKNVSYAWSSKEYDQYRSLREDDKEFKLFEGKKAIGLRAFYQFMLWFMVNKGVEIGSLVYKIDENDVDKNGKNRGLRKWKDVLCVANLNEETKRLIGVEEYSYKYFMDDDGDLCVYVGGSLVNDNKVFADMFKKLKTQDILDYILYFGGKKKTDI